MKCVWLGFFLIEFLLVLLFKLSVILEDDLSSDEVSEDGDVVEVLVFWFKLFKV